MAEPLNNPGVSAGGAFSGSTDRVLALGVFDLFHIGHLRYLQHAAQLGQPLYVGVAPDDMVVKNKGRYPVIPFAQRAELVAGVAGVSACFPVACPMAETQAAADWIASLGVDVVACGAEWQGQNRWLKLEAALATYGIRVAYLPMTEGVSSRGIRQCLTEVHVTIS